VPLAEVVDVNWYVHSEAEDEHEPVQTLISPEEVINGVKAAVVLLSKNGRSDVKISVDSPEVCSELDMFNDTSCACESVDG
jgi:hypothetical protein